MTTNYERIKNMSIEEMAMVLDDLANRFCDKIHCREACSVACNRQQCVKYIKQWLESEAE